ncbi:hypothetical protein KKC13_02635 [bacterium]|nr:hypothetical protein [bacterium]MBU1957140.1 hypothetical protein [bacterium]
MTIKEAILKVLDDVKKPISNSEVYEYITNKEYYIFERGKTPENTISAQLGNFIRSGDSRVKRLKGNGNYYLYYLSKYESQIEIYNIKEIDSCSIDSQKNYDERDLHLLFSTYSESLGIYTKTILHEESNRKDEHQKWIHPDMIGIDFLKFKTKETAGLVKALQSLDSFKLTSYELKKEISTDYELKKSYFQAVSNSSWANYGYLIAFEINSNLKEEMERLNQAFGIGIIELSAYPYNSQVLFQAKYKDLDFRTIDKLSNINKNFLKFMILLEEIITANGKHIDRTKKELIEYCDKILKSEDEIKDYCKQKSIPLELDEKGLD